MPSTYTTNLGIEKIATGEQSGIWGATTNTNLELLDQAVNGVVTVTLASAGTSGSPNTLPITSGVLSDGRNKFIEFNDGGDLGVTAYVQLTPNDAEKVVFMRNSLSGSRSVIVFQGTYNASNDFEIPAGKTVVLKFDGAGGSATVTDVFNDLELTAATINSLQLASGSTVTSILDEDNMASDSATALATQQSIKAYIDNNPQDLTAITTNVSPNTDDNNDLGSASKRWQDLYLSGGIYIGGTSSANFIDDYEEGTFTLSFVSGPSGVSAGGFSASTGTYVKNGNMVMGTIRCTFNAGAEFSNDTDFMIIQGAPLWPTTQQMTSVCTFTGGNIGLSGLGALELRPDVNLAGYFLPKCPFAYGNGTGGLGPYSGFAANFYFYVNQ